MSNVLEQIEFPLVRRQWAEYCENEASRERVLVAEPSFDRFVVEHLLAETNDGMALLDHCSLPHLGRIHPLTQDLNRMAGGGLANFETLWRIGDALSVFRQVSLAVASVKSEFAALGPLLDELPVLPQLEERLLQWLEPDGLVRSEASAELSTLRKKLASASQRVLDRIQGYTSGRHRDLLSDPLYTQRSGRYVIPLKSENKGKIKGIIHDTSASGQTIFIEPEDVVEAANQLRETEAAEKAELARIQKALCVEVAQHATAIRGGISAAEALDMVLSRVRFGLATRCSIAKRTEVHSLRLRNARHPLIDPGRVVPFSLHIDGKDQVLLITGPNTGGKTVTLKAVGLIVAMAQCGLMIPADESYVGFFPQIWADVGDQQSLQQSLSTFSGSIRTIAQIAHEVVPGALVLLDEMGAGTDPAEGAALARAILMFLQEKGARVFATTHHGQLKLLAFDRPGFVNASMEFDTKSLGPTYRLLVGASGSSHALMIASRYGVPAEIIEAAKASGPELNSEISVVLERLNQAQKLAQSAQSRADKLASSLAEWEQRAERTSREAEEARRKARAQAAETLEATLQKVRLETADILAELKADYSPEGLRRAREKLARTQAAGEKELKNLRPAAPPPPALSVGDSVKMRGQAQVGRVLSIQDRTAEVQVGALRLKVPLDKLEATTQATEPVRHKPRQNLGLAKSQTLSIELQVIGLREEEAREKIVRFLDEAQLAGYDSIRIVHGKGQGILRKMCHAVLREHRGVANFRAGEPAEGGDGATIVNLG